MTKTKYLASLLIALCAGAAFAVEPAIPRDAQIEAKVEKTLSRMTLEEKIGQMCQLNIDVFGTTDHSSGRPVFTLDEARIDTVIARWKVGSFLNAPATYAGSIEEWQKWIPAIQKSSMKHLGIPTIYGLDENHGSTYVLDGTIFPQPINVGASFNPELAKTMGIVTAYESRAADCPWVFNPTVDVCRNPVWPRIWESFGEDARVNARMAVAEIEGYQGSDLNHLGKYNVAACIKHYFAYGAPFSGQDRTPAYLSDQQIREKYFEPFRAAIRAGSLSLMVNSASINGQPIHASHKYLTEWLKDDLNWDGVVVTDWADIDNLFTRERVATDKKDAIRIAINAGVDMSMDPYSIDFCRLLKELVTEGKVPLSRIDDAARRIIRLKYRLGLFDKPNTGGRDYKDFGSDKFAAEALNAAIESEVLLKNNGILPLAPGKKILLTGPNANQMRCLNGGWTYTWQGSRNELASEKYNTIYEALCNKYGADNVTLAQGVTYNETADFQVENTPDFNAAVNAAANADVIIACVGENSYCETPGNISDIRLSENQRELVKRLAATGKPLVLILNEGRPRVISDIEPLADAVVDILLPGNYGADALAELLAGDANFSAKLPFTYPKELNKFTSYDFKVSEQVATMEGAYNYNANVTSQWPFGSGLSYTTYSYSNLRIANPEFRNGDTIRVTIDVTNSGNVAGKEVVLLFSSDLVASLVPDNKRLCDFTKVELAPGETKTVEFNVPANQLAFVGHDGKWILEEGDFMMHVGGHSAPLHCTSTHKWETPNL